MGLPSLKRKPFLTRLQFALEGIRFTWREEPSFRFQILAALGAFSVLALTQASPTWWAMVFLVVGAILAAELMNTALENTLDRLHPELHAAIKAAKDCAAAAVLVLSAVSIAIMSAYLYSVITH